MDGRLLSHRINLVRPWLKQKFGGPVAKVGLDAHLGCPNRDGTLAVKGCTFCPPAGAGKGKHQASLDEQLQTGIAKLKKTAHYRNKANSHILAYFQAYSSTHAPCDHLRDIYEKACDHPDIEGLIISTRPDCLDEPRWRLLNELKQKNSLMWLELGLQSAHDHTLKAISRGHDLKCFDEAVKIARNLGIPVVAHVILGLPGETQIQTTETADYLAKINIWGVKMHNLMVLGHTTLAKAYEAGSFIPWTRDQWVQAAVRFLAHISPHTLVHRLAADPGPDLLLAPDWVRQKDENLKCLGLELAAQDIHQGNECPCPDGEIRR